MTKTLIELSNKLFSRFGDTSGQFSSRRLTEPPDLKDQIERLKAICVGDVIPLYGSVRAIEYTIDESVFLAITLGFDTTETDASEIESATSNVASLMEDIPGAVFLYLADKLNLQPRPINPMLIEENILGPAAGPDGVGLDAVRDALEPVSFFQLNFESLSHDQSSARSVAYVLMTFGSTQRPCSTLTDSAVECLRRILIKDRLFSAERNLLSALSACSPRHAFLEVYRTLEFAFVLPRSMSLMKNLTSCGVTIPVDLTPIEFARLCNKTLSWKRVERDAIRMIFNNFMTHSPAIFDRVTQSCLPFDKFRGFVGLAVADEKQQYLDGFTNRYYELRNQVAHQLWPDDEILCEDGDWHELIEFTLLCIEYLYDRHLTVGVVCTD